MVISTSILKYIARGLFQLYGGVGSSAVRNELQWTDVGFWYKYAKCQCRKAVVDANHPKSCL